MVLHLVCDCGNVIAVVENSSGASVLCARCGRRLNPAQNVATSMDDATPLVVPDEGSTAHPNDNEVTQIAPSQRESPLPTNPLDGSDATRLFPPSFAVSNEVETHRPDVENANDATVISDRSNPSSRGSHIQSRVEKLDLSERVMGVVSRSSLPEGFSITKDDNLYQTIREYDKGGMGRIVIAYDKNLKREVARKELHEKHLQDNTIVRRFIGEAEITAQLEHPGIVPIHYLALDANDNPYYTMKLIKGHTYQEAVKAYHRNPNPSELLHLVRRLVSVCKTMAFAHKKGVIHRDLKPANIMLGEHGETLIMDWGLAKLYAKDLDDSSFDEVAVQHQSEPRPDLTIVGAIVGTPAFMSPEQASPKEFAVGPLADIFSLGAVLYYLLAGQTAFSGRNTHEVLKKVRATNPQKPSELKPNVPKGLEAICAMAMAKNPDDRYQTATDMDRDLCRWLDGEPVLAQKETVREKMRRWLEKHRIFSISAPLIVIALLVLTFFGIQIDRMMRSRRAVDQIQSVLTQPVDLTSELLVKVGSSFGIAVERIPSDEGGFRLRCDVEGVPETSHGLIEMMAPASYAWDLRQRSSFVFSLYEASNSGQHGGLENFSIRMGHGSTFFEYRPGEWWTDRKKDQWVSYSFPLSIPPNANSEWTRVATTPATPSMAKIEWIEFHFDIHDPMSFQVDRVSFRNNIMSMP